MLVVYSGMKMEQKYAENEMEIYGIKMEFCGTKTKTESFNMKQIWNFQKLKTERRFSAEHPR
jgi:hypothetical protein